MGNCVTEIPAADSQATIDQYTGRFRVETDCAAVADPARRGGFRYDRWLMAVRFSQLLFWSDRFPEEPSPMKPKAARKF